MSRRDELRERISELKRAGVILTADGPQVREHPERVRVVESVTPKRKARTKREMLAYIRETIQRRDGNTFLA